MIESRHAPKDLTGTRSPPRAARNHGVGGGRRRRERRVGGDTSASLTIQENADPTARADLEAFFDRLVPRDEPWYRHTAEGPDDMPSHIKAVLSDTSLVVPVVSGRLALGTWQGIYLFEHRDATSGRRILVTVT